MWLDGTCPLPALFILDASHRAAAGPPKPVCTCPSLVPLHSAHKLACQAPELKPISLRAAATIAGGEARGRLRMTARLGARGDG